MKLIQASLYFSVFYLTFPFQAYPVIAQSQTPSKNQEISQKLQTPLNHQANIKTIDDSIRFKPPIDDKPNPATVGAGTRGALCLKKQKMTPLLPQNKSGLTLDKHPTFFWYTPPSSVKTAEFAIISNDKEKVVYKTILTLPDEPGIVSYTLPDEAAGLEPNTTYRWYVTLICDSEDSSKNPFIEGIIKRTISKLTLSELLKKDNLLQMASKYAQNGIWHDALNSLVKLRCHRPDDEIVKERWKQFLESVKLNDFVSESLVNSCMNKN
jgi:hypothetical protein